MKVVWHKHNLWISSSIGFSHPGKYSYEVPLEDLSGVTKSLDESNVNQSQSLV